MTYIETEQTWAERFNEPIPDNVPDIDCEMADIKDAMMGIDVQFSQQKNAGYRADDPTWHPRALAAKGHMIRRLSDLKLAKAALMGADKAKKAAEKAARAALTAQPADEKWKARYQALHDWVWDTFPDRRGEIAAVIYASKREQTTVSGEATP